MAIEINDTKVPIEFTGLDLLAHALRKIDFDGMDARQFTGTLQRGTGGEANDGKKFPFWHLLRAAKYHKALLSSNTPASATEGRVQIDASVFLISAPDFNWFPSVDLQPLHSSVWFGMVSRLAAECVNASLLHCSKISVGA
jgi:hypothetical protein